MERRVGGGAGSGHRLKPAAARNTVPRDSLKIRPGGLKDTNKEIMRLALISDIHGNTIALDAVLEDAARQQVTG